MRFLNCYVRTSIKREHTNPLLIGQTQIKRLQVEAPLSQADTIGSIP
jgi:hypothetical protein